MKIYSSRLSRRYPFLSDILDKMIGKDIWLLINYDSGLNDNFYPQDYWIKVISRENSGYNVIFVNDNLYGYDVNNINDRMPEILDESKVLHIFRPYEMLSSEELVQEHELDY